MKRDVVVVGAGPAGSSTALALARAGVDALMLDRATLPRWKVCGGCLGPTALELLRGMDLLEAVEATGAAPISVMELRAGSGRARLRLPGTLSLSRYRLDRLLADAVAAEGGSVRFGVRVEGVTPRDDGVEIRVREGGEPRRIRARVVVDATGLGGLHLGGQRFAEEVAEGSRVGLGAVFPAGARHDGPPGELRMVVGRHGYVGMVRTEDGSLDVAAAVDRDLIARLGAEGAVSSILASGGDRLPAGDPVFGWRGTPALTRRHARAAEGAVFRVGDAAGYVEPFTGEGMGWAMAGGVAAAPLVQAAVARRSPPSTVVAAGAGHLGGAARRWVLAHRRVVGRRQRACRLLAAGLRRPAWVRAAVVALGVAPSLARPVMGATGRAPELPATVSVAP